MKIEITDNYVCVGGTFYYREQGDTCVEQENVCRECKMELIEDRWADDCSCNAWECSECCYVSYISNLCSKPRYCSDCGARVID